MPKLVVENSVTKKVNTYLIVCDSDLPEILGEDIDTVAFHHSAILKSAKSIKHLPVGEMQSYQELMEELSFAKSYINSILECDLKSLRMQLDDTESALKTIELQLKRFPWWKRIQLVFTGYEIFLAKAYQSLNQTGQSK